MQNQGYRGSRWRAVATLLCYWCLRGSRAKPEQGANAERGKNTNQGGAAGDGDAAALSGPLGTGDGHCVVSERAYLVDSGPGSGAARGGGGKGHAGAGIDEFEGGLPHPSAFRPHRGLSEFTLR